MAVRIKQKNPDALKRIVDKYREDYAVAVGLPGSKTGSIKYPDTKDGKAGPRVIDVAVWNNFGTSTIPARPFMSIARRPAIETIQPIVRKLSRDINSGSITKKRIGEIVGPVVVGVWQQTITDIQEPPNAPSTIRRKGSSNPLIDTGLLRQSINFEVRRTKEKR